MENAMSKNKVVPGKNNYSDLAEIRPFGENGVFGSTGSNIRNFTSFEKRVKKNKLPTIKENLEVNHEPGPEPEEETESEQEPQPEEPKMDAATSETDDLETEEQEKDVEKVVKKNLLSNLTSFKKPEMNLSIIKEEDPKLEEPQKAAKKVESKGSLNPVDEIIVDEGVPITATAKASKLNANMPGDVQNVDPNHDALSPQSTVKAAKTSKLNANMVGDGAAVDDLDDMRNTLNPVQDGVPETLDTKEGVAITKSVVLEEKDVEQEPAVLNNEDDEVPKTLDKKVMTPKLVLQKKEEDVDPETFVPNNEDDAPGSESNAGIQPQVDTQNPIPNDDENSPSLDEDQKESLDEDQKESLDAGVKEKFQKVNKQIRETLLDTHVIANDEDASPASEQIGGEEE
eukprot:239971_1